MEFLLYIYYNFTTSINFYNHYIPYAFLLILSGAFYLIGYCVNILLNNKDDKSSSTPCIPHS